MMLKVKTVQVCTLHPFSLTLCVCILVSLSSRVMCECNTVPVSVLRSRADVPVSQSDGARHYRVGPASQHLQLASDGVGAHAAHVGTFGESTCPILHLSSSGAFARFAVRVAESGTRKRRRAYAARSRLESAPYMVTTAWSLLRAQLDQVMHLVLPLAGIYRLRRTLRLRADERRHALPRRPSARRVVRRAAREAGPRCRTRARRRTWR